MTLAEFAQLFDCSIPQILDKLRNDKSDFWRWWWTQFASEQFGLKTGNLRQCLSPFQKLREGIDVEPFLQELEALPDGWPVDTGRKTIGVQRHTDSISLRQAAYRPTPGADKIRTMIDVHESHTGQLACYFPQLMGFLNALAEQQGKGSLSRAMIVRLTPKQRVGRHWDCGYYYLCRDRYHLVLRTFGSKMECGGVRTVWNIGELWWFNNNLWHSAMNEGDDWRIHVIFDVLPYRNIGLVDEFKLHTAYYANHVRQHGDVDTLSA